MLVMQIQFNFSKLHYFQISNGEQHCDLTGFNSKKNKKKLVYWFYQVGECSFHCILRTTYCDYYFWSKVSSVQIFKNCTFFILQKEHHCDLTGFYRQKILMEVLFHAVTDTIWLLSIIWINVYAISVQWCRTCMVFLALCL